MPFNHWDGVFKKMVCTAVTALACFASARAQTNAAAQDHVVAIRVGERYVTLAPASSNAFRLSTSYSTAATAIPSTFLANARQTNDETFTNITDGDWQGLETAAGRLLVNAKSGTWKVERLDHTIVIPESSLGQLASVNSSNAQLRVEVACGKNECGGFYGSGNGVPALRQSDAKPHVGNGIAVMPYYWSPAGYAILAVSTNDNLPARWTCNTNAASTTWTFPGDRADIYIMPAHTLREATAAYTALIGRAPVPPRWTMGYLQSRWGWKNRAYIEDTLKQFQRRHLPVDAFIYDFEWYTIEPDYDVPPEGEAGFSDFGWNAKLFPDPARQIRDYQKQGVHFVGIRKPRIGNADTLEFVRENGWDMRGPGLRRTDKYQSRDVDFRNPAFESWYIGHITNLFSRGVDGWWNDEGELSFTTYYYWNLAESRALAEVRPGHRLWTINRAFSPGVPRLGGAAWTGDIRSTWKALKEVPADLLNWSLAGMVYGGCDIGGFDGTDPSPEMLARWMQAGVFFLVMRAHSSLVRKPHFPWLFGRDAEVAMRHALELRYRLIPYYYSLAHETEETGVPLMRPLTMEFPQDEPAKDLTDEWLMGSGLLAAPILQEGGKRSIYLPEGTWHRFGTNEAIAGGKRFEISAALDEIPVYVRAGTILPLGPVIEHTMQLPGGPLEVQIYPGANATFTLVEDDGETVAYRNGAVRRTTFHWDDAQRTFSWERAGDYAGKDCFQKIHVRLLDPKGIVSRDAKLADEGNVSFKTNAGK